MKTNRTLSDLLNRDISCSCGKTHRCDIRSVHIGKNALEALPQATEGYQSIFLVADRNTYPLCADRVIALLGDKLKKMHVFEVDGYLIPDEEAIAAIDAVIPEGIDLVLGIGSGVINDLCKYVSFRRGIRCGIIASATSMDGYASSGAAMIIGGMKVTYTMHAPDIIIGDTAILCNAPMEMIRAGYADIIGKYSALCDWRLSELVNGEYLCPEIYRIVMDKTNEIRALAKSIARREEDAIAALMEALVLIGSCLTLVNTTRPGSGSEHHLSHYFEITGLIENKPYFLHGTDVGYSTVVTAALRERIRAIQSPVFVSDDPALRARCYRKIYGRFAEEVKSIQDAAKRYENPIHDRYLAHWDEVRSILAECPTAKAIEEMLLDVGFEMAPFEESYGKSKIENGILFGKDLKDRYSVLWLYYDLFFDAAAAKSILRNTTYDFMVASVKNERHAIDELLKVMDRNEFERALRFLLDSPLTIISACGSSGFTCRKLAHSLCCVECPAKFIPPSDAVHGGMGALKKGATLILVSKGGKTEELIPLAEIAKRKEANVILVTAKRDAALSRYADVILLLPDVRESDRFDMMSTASFAANIAIFDALMMGIMEEKEFGEEEFSLIHPGGAVGKRIGG